MSQLVSDFYDEFRNEPSKALSLSLKLTREEQELLESFQAYVTEGVQEKISKDNSVKISINDLSHKLIFSAIRADKKFLKKHLSEKKEMKK